MPKEILVSYGVDIDAVGGWLGSYGGENSPGDISRGLFAGEVGVPRVLELFRRAGHPPDVLLAGPLDRDVPGRVRRVRRGRPRDRRARLQPREPDRHEQAAGVRRAGPLHRAHRVARRARRPTGYVAPWWEFSEITNELVLDRGLTYDHSLMHDDFTPYYVRVGDSWTKIDLSADAADWMKPLQRGEETDLVELPANWYLDDLPPMMFVKGSPNSHGFVNPHDIEQLWRDQFDWVYREMDYAVFTMTIHPDVSGRPQVLLMHERLIEYINSHEGVRWLTFDEIANDFLRRSPRGS